MPNHRVRLQQKEAVAEGTVAFHFQKPADLEFKAGQFIDVTLIDPQETDAEGNTRSFSIASAPFETDLIIATRMRDTAFKRVLNSLALGTEVSIAGPFGSFTLRQDSQPAVFLAGGIGITPFRSMLLQAFHDRMVRRFVLFYSNRRPEDAAFLEELQQLDRNAGGFRLIAVMTDMKKSRRPGRERLDASTRPCWRSMSVSSMDPSTMLPDLPGWSRRCRRCLTRRASRRMTWWPRSFRGTRYP